MDVAIVVSLVAYKLTFQFVAKTTLFGSERASGLKQAHKKWQREMVLFVVRYHIYGGHY
jgi:hypothetical protein